MAVIPNSMKEEARGIATTMAISLYELEVDYWKGHLTKEEIVEKYRAIARRYFEDFTRMTARVLILRAIEDCLRTGNHD